MYAKTLSEIEEKLLEVGIGTVWSQWSALGAGTLQDRKDISAIIDPEALLLLSLYLIPEERRLRDLVQWWAEVGSELLSLQRTKTLLDDFPSDVNRRVKTYSRWATEAGDKRWQKYAEEETQQFDRDRKGPEKPDLGSPSSLLYRLRAGFGVGAKADVLAYLLGIGEQSATTKEAVRATSYSRATVQGALGDLSRAGFIKSTSEYPKEYFAPLGSWEVLVLGDNHSNDRFPQWRHWGKVYAFLAQSKQWIEEAENQSEYISSTRARDIFQDFQTTFEANRVQVLSPEKYQGSKYVDGFAQTVAKVTEWTEENV